MLKKDQDASCSEDGNIFFMLGKVRQTLKANGQADKAREVSERVMASQTYYQAIEILMEYVVVE